MRFLIMGYGSMGKRHHRNLLACLPSADVVIYDPMLFPDVGAYPLADAAIIASPAHLHQEHMAWCSCKKIPFFVEKPMTGQVPYTAEQERSAVGFNYRFHSQWPEIMKLASEGFLHFYAHEQLVARYGRTVGWTSASHAIDMAVQALGPPLRGGIALQSDGIVLFGHIDHTKGRSEYDYNMDAQRKDVWISGRGSQLSLVKDESCYRKEMDAWVELLLHQTRDSRLATIEHGYMVDNILKECIDVAR